MLMCEGLKEVKRVCAGGRASNRVVPSFARLVTGITIWHYYGNDRAYCNQRVATSATGAHSTTSR